MDQYRGVVKQHTSFTLDLLRHTKDGSTYRYSSNFRQDTALIRSSPCDPSCQVLASV